MRTSFRSLLYSDSAFPRQICTALVLLLCAVVLILAGSQAFADRGYGGHGYYRGGGHYGGHGYYGGHGHYRGYYGSGLSLGLYYGGPYWWGGGWGYPYPYYSYPAYPAYYPYYAPEVNIQSSPPVYIERGSSSSGQMPEPGIWFYCPEAKKYYPYVKECPGGWQSVPAQPPAQEK